MTTIEPPRTSDYDLLHDSSAREQGMRMPQFLQRAGAMVVRLAGTIQTRAENGPAASALAESSRAGTEAYRHVVYNTRRQGQA